MVFYAGRRRDDCEEKISAGRRRDGCCWLARNAPPTSDSLFVCFTHHPICIVTASLFQFHHLCALVGTRLLISFFLGLRLPKRRLLMFVWRLPRRRLLVRRLASSDNTPIHRSPFSGWGIRKAEGEVMRFPGTRRAPPPPLGDLPCLSSPLLISSPSRRRRRRQTTLVRRLKDGTARFELLEDSVPPVSHSFARISSSLGGWSAALNKVEHYAVQKVAGDGRCMFRALVKGMAKNKGIPLNPREEVQDADDLRMAVKEVICDSETERLKYEEALIAITVEESLKRYCQRIRRPNFWGGESELLVLSKLCCQPIIIYIPEHEHRGRGNGFIPIAEYGLEFTKNSKQGKKRTPVRLVYSGKNHYDLLV